MKQAVDINIFFANSYQCPCNRNGDCQMQIIDSSQRETGYGGTTTDFTYDLCGPDTCPVAFWLNGGNIPE